MRPGGRGRGPLVMVWRGALMAWAVLFSMMGEGEAMELPGRFVSTAWLAEHLEEKDLRIVQVGGEKFYDSLHVPGAALMPYGELVMERGGVPGMRADEARLTALFSRYGIADGVTVVAYDAAGGMDAARLAWTLASLGFMNTAVLDGGIVAWVNEKRPIAQQAPVLTPASFTPRPDPSVVIGWEETLAVAENPSAAPLILDTRSGREYVGMTLRPPRGHLAGAVHLEWTETLVDPNNNPVLKDKESLRALFAGVGVSDPAREVILYCETAHRASQSWVLLKELGFAKARLYDGSMAEWRVRDLPVVGGNAPR